MGKSCQSLLFPQFLTLSDRCSELLPGNCSERTKLCRPAIKKQKKMYDGNTRKGKKFQNQSYSLKAQKRKLYEKIRSLESVIVEIKDKFSLPEV